MRTQRLIVAGLLLASMALTGCEWLDTLDTAKSHAKLAAVPPSYTGPGPATVNFNGSIHVNAPCEVKYRIVRSDGISTPLESLDFDHPDTKSVSKSWTFTSAWKGWAKLQVESPEWAESKPALFTANIHAVKVHLAAIPAMIKAPGNIKFEATLDITKTLDITYTFIHGDGTATLAKTVHLVGPGNHKISETRLFPAPASNWERFKVISPEEVLSNTVLYKVNP